MIVIFDLDGTLTDTFHRDHLVQHSANLLNDWDRFTEEAENDPLIKPVIDLYEALHVQRHTLLIWTGRAWSVERLRQWWEGRQGLPAPRQYRTRPPRDRQPSWVLKHSFLVDWLRAGNNRPDLALDNDETMCSVWQNNGITSLHVSAIPKV